jgi:hypothetical protein
MAHEILIAHCPEDKAMAIVTCAALEKDGFKCWLAHRDLGKKRDTFKAINDAITNSKAMVVIVSEDANKTDVMAGQMNVAINSDVIFIPIRINKVEPEGVLQFYLADTQWFDVTDPPTEEQLLSLASMVKQIIAQRERESQKGAVKRFLIDANLKPKTVKYIRTALWVIGTALITYGAYAILLSLSRLLTKLEDLLALL